MSLLWVGFGRRVEAGVLAALLLGGLGQVLVHHGAVVLNHVLQQT